MKSYPINIGLQLIFLSLIITFTSCNLSEKEEPVTEVKQTITLLISANTGYMTGLTENNHECMLVKEKGQTSWNTLGFESIHGFTYKKGYNYELLVTKTTYYPPPADGGACRYDLVDILSIDPHP